MQRVYIIVTKGNLGGAQQYVRALAESLVRSGAFSPEVICGSGEGLAHMLHEEKIPAVQFPGLTNGSFFADLRLVGYLYRKYLADRTSIFHFNSSKMLFAMYLLSKFIPHDNIVFTCHGFPWIQNESGFLTDLKRYLFRHMADSGGNVICVSNFVKEELAHIGISTNLTVIKNTLGRSRAAQFINAEFRLKDGRQECLRIVSFAELNSNKGIKDFLLYLVKNAFDIFSLIRWDIYGQGVDYDDISRIIDSNHLSGSVRLMGLTREPQFEIKKYDMLLVPSLNESFGMVVLEAAAAGIYSVVNKVGGLPEAVVHEVGRVCDGFDEMATTLRELCDVDLSFPADYLTQSLEYWVLLEFNWANKHFEIYRK